MQDLIPDEYAKFKRPKEMHIDLYGGPDDLLNIWETGGKISGSPLLSTLVAVLTTIVQRAFHCCQAKECLESTFLNIKTQSCIVC